MSKKRIATLEQLESLVLNPKISKLDKYTIFSNALQDFPIIFISIILDDPESSDGIDDPENRLIPQMQKIISEIRNDPAAKKYSAFTVTLNESSERVTPPDILIDFRE